MRCCAKRFESLICGAALLLFALTAQAAEISIRSPQLVANDDGYSLSADFNINFNTRLEEAVNRGIVLYFAAVSLVHRRQFPAPELCFIG